MTLIVLIAAVFHNVVTTSELVVPSSLLIFQVIWGISWVVYTCFVAPIGLMLGQRIAGWAPRSLGLGWVDRWFEVPSDAALVRNYAMFTLVLEHIVYHGVTGTGTALLYCLYGFSCGLSILYGLRHLERMHNIRVPLSGFMGILLVGNIQSLRILISQWRTNTLPRAASWAWFTLLAFGLGSVSPAYAVSGSN